MSQPSKSSKTHDLARLKKDSVTGSSQSQQFINFAREIGTDDNGGHREGGFCAQRLPERRGSADEKAAGDTDRRDVVMLDGAAATAFSTS